MARYLFNTGNTKTTFGANDKFAVGVDSEGKTYNIEFQYLETQLSIGLTPTFDSVTLNSQAVNNSDAVRLDQVYSLINGLDWQDAVLSKNLSTPPISPIIGDRYIVGVSGTGDWLGEDDNITEWDGSDWVFYDVQEGWAVWVKDLDTNYQFNGISWVEMGSTVSHNNTTGLQGGTSSEYYHLTEAEHTFLIGKTFYYSGNFVAGTDYEVPLTFSTGLDRTGNTVTNTDKGSDAVTTHESTFNHTNYDTAYNHTLLTNNPHNVLASQITDIGQSLTTTSSPAFSTVKLTGLTDGYLPYHVNDSTGLANSPIYTDGTNTKIQQNNLGTDWKSVFDFFALIANDFRFAIVSDDSGSYGSGMSLKQVSGTTFQNAWDIIRQTNVSGGGNGQLQIKYGVYSDSSGNTGVMALTPAYNVLIGTTTDSGYKLDVNGTTRVADKFYIGTTTAPATDAGTLNALVWDNTNGEVKQRSISTGVTSVAAGDGMDFTTITSTGSATLGTPSSLTSITTNAVTTTSHTHAVEIANQTSDTSTATPTPTGNYKENEYFLTALATNATFAAPSGTPSNGNTLLIRIEDDGTSRTLAWNAIYEVVGVTLPTSTTAGKKMYIGCIYNSTDSKWDVVSVINE